MTVTDFRVGDRVRSIAPQAWPGALGTVVEVADRDLYPVAVDVDDDLDPRPWWMDVDELEPAPEPDVCKACGEHVSAPHSPQCPEDALNRIAEVVQGVSPAPEWDDLDDPVLRAWRELRSGALADVETILRESGRL